MMKQQDNKQVDQTKQKEWDYHLTKHFYHTLQKYQPLFDETNYYPLFLKNKQSSGTLAYLIIFNCFELLISYYTYHLIQEKMQQQLLLWISLIFNLVLLFTIDLSYFLVLYMNPGVKDLRQITEKDYQTQGKQFCVYCEGYKTTQYRHCQLCKVCTYKNDHHCSVFERCVGGDQRFAFFVFLIAVCIICFTNMAFLIGLMISS